MKSFLFARPVLLLFLLLSSSLTQAGPRATGPARPGYWNIETNLTTRDHTIVRFYNDQHQLVYEEQLPNLCLDLSGKTRLCRRTARQLNQMLAHLLRDSTAARQPDLLALQFGPNRRGQRGFAGR